MWGGGGGGGGGGQCTSACRNASTINKSEKDLESPPVQDVFWLTPGLISY